MLSHPHLGQTIGDVEIELEQLADTKGENCRGEFGSAVEVLRAPAATQRQNNVRSEGRLLLTMSP